MMRPKHDITDAPFVVDSEPKAEWAMRRLAELRDRLGRHESEAAWYRARIDAWLVDVRRRLNPDVAYFEGLLTTYLRTERERTLAERGPKKATKSIPLPSGRIRSSGPGTGRMTVVDAAAFIAWAKSSGRTDLCTMEPSSSSIRAAATRDGEVVVIEGQLVDLLTGMPMPGVVYTPGDVTYKADPFPLSQSDRTLDLTTDHQEEA